MIQCDNFSTSGSGDIPIISHTTGLSFNIDFNFLNWNLLPNYYRRSQLQQYVNSIYAPIKNFWDFNFLAYRKKSLQESRINAQRIVLEAYLRRLYNTCEITIVNNFSEIEFTYLYQQSEIQDNDSFNTYLYQIGETPETEQVYIYTKAEASLSTDFEVHIPQGLIDIGVRIDEIEAIIDRYKAMGTEYIVIID